MDKNEIGNDSGQEAVGILYGVMAYVLWGLLPLYWKLLKQIPAIEILAHRIIWSFVFVGILLMVTGKAVNLYSAFRNKKNICYILLCSIFLSINWGTYIWAVNSNRVLETSMGYYINPLMSVILGMLVLKEKLNSWQYGSLVLAALGVAVITVQYGMIPWVSLILAISFAIYGLFKKMIIIDSMTGLAIETAIMVPAALAYLGWKQMQGILDYGTLPLLTIVLLLCSGVATATPLLWFAMATKRVQLVTIGFLEYISPTITMFLGIFVFGENFTKTHLISFGFIWAALIMFSLSKIKLINKVDKGTVKIQT